MTNLALIAELITLLHWAIVHIMIYTCQWLSIFVYNNLINYMCAHMFCVCLGLYVTACSYTHTMSVRACVRACAHLYMLAYACICACVRSYSCERVHTFLLSVLLSCNNKTKAEVSPATNAMQCNAMQCNAMQCNAMQCNAMQCNAMQCNAMQCNAMQCNVMFCPPLTRRPVRSICRP